MEDQHASEAVVVSVENGIADVRINRPDKLNAINNDVFDSLIRIADDLEADRRVRVVVLSGNGDGFCAGLDMSLFAGMRDTDASAESLETLSTRTHGIANRPQQAVWAWRSLRVPVICAVHGVALGGGFQVMLGSDIRIVHPQTRLSILEIKWGLIPDMAGTPIMHSLAADDVIRELTYTGRVFSGEEAARYGFATRTSETPFEDALALAQEIASKSPDAVQTAKTLYNRVAHSDAAGQLLSESELQDRLMGKPNQLESVFAALEKRPAVFSD
ncbi:MAG: crotonase/enoyl-CoA hydratase family protein [Congregibacter sp.]